MPSELGDFLRARRTDSSLSPASTPGVGRRRLSGLRREEVAAASGISVDYYTRLEQGRERNPSDAVVAALARVLRLQTDAQAHLLRLRNGGDPTGIGRPDDGQLAARLSSLVEAVRPNAAYVLDRMSFMVSANAEGLALYDGFAELPHEQRNTCRYLFTDSRARRTFVDWDVVARGAVAHLRAANSDDLQNRELQALVAEISAESMEFERWWAEHIVERRRASVTHVRTGDSVVVRRYEVLHLPDEQLRMTLWLPPA